MYTNYKTARDMSWKVLIETGISQLPVKLSVIARYYGIQVLSYAESNKKYSDAEDGYSTKHNGIFLIYYNEAKPSTRIRFTIAHELGHCLLNHIKDNEETFRLNSEIDTYTDVKEIMANVFARDILMPATVLHSICASSGADIARICNVSMQSAGIRYNRLLELNKRSMYNKHPLERQVHNQFKKFIEKQGVL